MSPILKPFIITSSVMAGYAAAAALVVVVSANARAEAAADASKPAQAAEAPHAPITSPEKAQAYVQHVLPNVRVAAAYVDAKPQPHFHVELRLADGRTGRLDVEPQTGALSWRRPAVLDD